MSQNWTGFENSGNIGSKTDPFIGGKKGLSEKDGTLKQLPFLTSLKNDGDSIVSSTLCVAVRLEGSESSATELLVRVEGARIKFLLRLAAIAAGKLEVITTQRILYQN